MVEHGGTGSSAAAPIAKKVIKKTLERHDLRTSINTQIGRNLMIESRSIHSNLTLRDKIYSIDYVLVISIIILGIISMFAMYSTDGGEFKYHTKSHIIRFTISFLFFIGFFLCK